MKRIIAALFCALGLVLAMPVAAQQQCYSPAELQAEQLLRLHSELMVITYACKQGSKAQDLLFFYEGFTRNNIRYLHDAEQTLIHYYKGRYHDDGIARLDQLHTMLGNEISQNAANDSAPLFCRQYRDRPIEFFYATPLQLQDVLDKMVIKRVSYEKQCKPEPAHTKTARAGRMDKKTP